MEGGQITVVIADDEPLARSALRLSLGTSGRFKLVAEAEHGQGAVDCCLKHKPHLLILDLSMPGTDGFYALEQLAIYALAIKIAVCSSHDPDTVRPRVMALGAHCCIGKDLAPSQLVRTLLLLFDD